MLLGLSVGMLGVVSALLIPIAGQGLGGICGFVGVALGVAGVAAAFIGYGTMTRAPTPPPR